MNPDYPADGSRPKAMNGDGFGFSSIHSDPSAHLLAATQPPVSDRAPILLSNNVLQPANAAPMGQLNYPDAQHKPQPVSSPAAPAFENSMKSMLPAAVVASPYRDPPNSQPSQGAHDSYSTKEELGNDPPGMLPFNSGTRGSPPHDTLQSMEIDQEAPVEGVPTKRPARTNLNEEPPPPHHAPSPPMDQQDVASGGRGDSAPGMRELRVEDALQYLDQVKIEFRDRPQIYNQFLAIMKNFKSQEVDTPGVIRRVSKLFRGYNNLILGFNTFLPDGYKISLADLERQEAEDRAAAAAQAQLKPPPVAPAPPHRVAGPPQVPGGWNVAKTGSHDSGPSESAPRKKTPPAGPKPPPPAQRQGQQPPQPPPPAQGHQTVEFDHAISYVTTIKRRFANDPSTYHRFLEILHTYQKEQRGIKEVLEQVAILFQDHPDLLKEFTFFLPDAVQDQAKEKLHKAAAESESRLQRQQQLQEYQHMAATSHGSHQKFIDMTRSGMDDSRGRKRSLDGLTTENVYNSAVERQFFDAAREALTSYTRDGGQAWAEFLKCMDMYAQDILSRNEMLNFVEPLLGKRNTKLFEEFKRILAVAGSPSHPLPLMEDAWHSVPLSEIDFSRCRRCSPSYRALPRDYPAPPCSDRSEEEARVLNSVWVSLPVGSEESYTFRHMRRNTYEETLFRAEDERFEIDMAIDSNAATLQRLEPIAQEIALLAQEELSSPDLGTKPVVDGAGLGGRRFQYTFDKKILGVIHRNSITRIYGDSGQEILDLMIKNPTVVVPIVVERLRQKAEEWKVVRERLNRNWKELAQHNYYKSLDHRSLTWRTTDKRATSTRTLILEIKDRAANGGIEGPEAVKQKIEKAKEEHGSFYEVTMAEVISKNLDLTFLPKPDGRLFTPHLSLMYENNSWAQRDAYRILAFALERGHITPADKERCHRLWMDFLGPFLGLTMNWMQRPAVAYQESTAPTTIKPLGAVKPPVVSEDDDDESMDEDAGLGGNVITEELVPNGDANNAYTDHHPLPAGAHVSTLYGEGKILQFRRSDHVYVVQLEFGAVGYLRPATVLCSILPVERSAYTRELCSKDVSKLARPGDQLVFGTQSLYLFFRLHQILVCRLNTAKRLAYSVGDDRSLKTLVEQMPDKNRKAVGRRRYEAYLSLVYSLLDGGVGGAAEGGKYEDRVRSLLGHGAFELATMDKLISHIWKNIQSMAGDETTWNLVQLYRRHLSSGVFRPEAYRQEAAYHSEGEPMYAFQYCPVQQKDSAVLYFEYVGVMEEGESEGDEVDENPTIDVAEEPELPANNKRQKR